ncbi:enoyl-CoA hydratase [Hyphomicrobium sp.]|jgi:enoyl-CoA hydratase/carnithine racemase|uniref:enoyl-CoA hydratase n=1 Tax=Hyphomicrobium sp. TaxID=82 RepID=UPI003569DEE0
MADAAEVANPTLRYATDGAVAWIAADNPARMNALTAAMWKAIPDAVAEAVRDPNVRVIVFRGSGDKAFSAGADISEFESSRTGDAAKTYDALNEAAFNALIGCPKPTIAMIHGFCLGGGLGLALCCDMRIADDASQFAIPAAKLGIGYNARWVRPILAAVPAARAKELLFTGRRFRSADAEAMGLISQLVPKTDLETTVRALALEIAGNAPLSVAAAKKVIDEISRHPEHPDMPVLDAAVAACFESDDYAEGRRAFLEKRKPQFKGK